MISNSQQPSEQIDLRAQQEEFLKKILTLNKPQGLSQADDTDPYVWKLLVFDYHCQEILSTVFNVGDLREQNVTLHLQLHQDREKIHGVNTIYFIKPTEENINRIIEDFKQDLYDSVYLNFAYPISLDLLQRLALAIGKQDSLYKLKQVNQYHINYIASTPSLFDFDIKDIYKRIRDHDEAPQLIEEIAHSLISIMMSLRMLPIVFYQKGFSETVAKKIESLMDDVIAEHHLKNPNEPYFKNQGYIILANRDIDHACLLIHSWYYGALIDDLLRIRNNKVKLCSTETKNETIEYDLNYKSDTKWVEKMNSPIPEIFDLHEVEAKELQEAYSSMGHKKEGQNLENMTANLSDALDKVPELMEKKKRFEMQSNLTSYISSQISNRSLDKLYEIEEKLITHKYLSSKERDEFYEILFQGATQKEEIYDRVRALAIYLQSMEDTNQNDINKIELAVGSISEKADENIKNYLQNRRLKPKDQGSEQQQSQSSNQMFGISMLQGITQQIKSKGKGLIKNMVGKDKGFVSGQLLADLISNKNFLDSEGIEHFNLASKVDSKDLNKTNDYIVFMVDGGCLTEYQNFIEMGKKLNGNIIYGSSYIYNATEFLSQV